MDSIELMEDLSRKDIVKILYSTIFKFINISNGGRTTAIFKEVHLSPRLRADILSLSYNDRVTIVELKTCKEDFTRDSKWKKYMDYCDYMWFMCPTGVIAITDLPQNVGLIWVDLESKRFSIKRSPKILKPKNLSQGWLKQTYKKLAFRKFASVDGRIFDIEKDVFFKLI